MSIIAAILSITGNLLVNKKRKSGFVVWTAANVLWVRVAFLTPNYPQALMFLVYSALNVMGFLEWSGDENNRKKVHKRN